MIELKVGKTYRNGFGKEIQIVSQDTDGRYLFKGHNGGSYTGNGAFNRTFESADDLIEEVTFDLTHSNIQLLRNTLISRLNNLEFLIWENKEWSKRLYRQATPESADGIVAFHELNKCKDSIRYCKKERKHVAELLRKLKKQQAYLLRNNAKV